MSARGATEVHRNEESTSKGGPATILLATDDSRGSELAARTAAEYSRTFGSRLYLAHVMPVSSFSSGFDPDAGDTLTIYDEDAEHARDLLGKLVRQLEEENVIVEKTELRTGEPGIEIVALAEEIVADLIVVGSRGAGGLKRAPMGSVSESIVRHAHSTVLVVRDQESTSDGKEA
ncbi:universal stress protein [soil metagenome]